MEINYSGANQQPIHRNTNNNNNTAVERSQKKKI